MDIRLEISRDNYRWYKFSSVIPRSPGLIVLELYEETWNLELMQVYPTGQGHGSRFLWEVLGRETLNPAHMTVCPTSSGSRRFFQRHGFVLA